MAPCGEFSFQWGLNCADIKTNSLLSTFKTYIHKVISAKGEQIVHQLFLFTLIFRFTAGTPVVASLALSSNAATKLVGEIRRFVAHQLQTH